MKKELKDLTLAEYKNLDKIGFLYELYPEATGSYKDDCGESVTPKYIGKGNWGHGEYFECPNCKYGGIENEFNYCPNCGKKLHWSRKI